MSAPDPSLIPVTRKRIASIDLIRGLVMVLMVLDHTRDYFHEGQWLYGATDPAATNLPVYLTRWITHLCAPVFVFLSGTSAYLYGSKQHSKRTLAHFLFTRGLMLVVLELTLVNFAWHFSWRIITLQVIWAIGWSMMLLSGLVYLKSRWVGLLGFAIVFLHNAFPVIKTTDTPGEIFYQFLNGVAWMETPWAIVVIGYAILPWAGLMMIGYWAGTLFRPDTAQDRRLKTLFGAGVGSLALFFILRIPNLYGDPTPWQSYPAGMQTFFSFFNVTKYPPSLQYHLITMGISLILLALAERAREKWSQWIILFGRVPLFFYILHLYLLHVLATLTGLALGYPSDAMLHQSAIYWPEVPEGYGYSLPIVYLVWIGVVLLLYPLCRWYMGVKRRSEHPVFSYI